MLKKFLLITFLAAAFFAGYSLTERFFEFRKIPLPFQFFGIFVGFTLVSWVMAAVEFLRSRDTPKARASNAKTFEQKPKIVYTEILK